MTGQTKNDKRVISKKWFLDSENKDQIMSKCLEILTKADQRCLELCGNSAEYEEKQILRDIQDDIRSIQADVREKEQKLDTLRSLTLNRQTYLRNSGHLSSDEREQQIRLLERDLSDMEERIRNFVQEKENEIAELQKESEDTRKSRRQQIREIQTELMEQIPPPVFGSAVQAMDFYHIRRLKHREKYICQCQLGVIHHECSPEGAGMLGALYPDAVRGGQLEVPYILSRNHAVYQLFLYQEENKELAWQHFQTMCLGQLVLHRGFEYELIAVLNGEDGRNDREFLSDIRESGIRENIRESGGRENFRKSGNRENIREADCRENIRVISPQNLEEEIREIKEYCMYIRTNVLENRYHTVWEYNRENPTRKLPYKGIALWDFPMGLSAETVNEIYQIYNMLESCGVFFLFFVNDDFDGGEAVFQEIRKMMEALPVLVFNSEVQEYEALGDRSYTYKIEKYDDLQNSET